MNESENAKAIERVAVKFPMPWTVSFVEVPANETCHHKSRTWVLLDANGRRVWWTEDVVRTICEMMNAAMSENAK